MYISFDYFDDARERGRDWAESLPDTLQAVISEYVIIFAITARGVWYSEAGHEWEFGGSKTDMRAYLADLAATL